MTEASDKSYRPYALLAELTYRCPLHCPYCSNPVRLPQGEELTTAEWIRIFHEAARLGVLHLGLSGGEPLARSDLPELIRAAETEGLYTNLITSAIGLSLDRARTLAAAGLRSVQISFQAHAAAVGDPIAGITAHHRKREAAAHVTAAGMALSLNVVLHRSNLDFLEPIIALAESMGVARLELANVQYYGWADLNRQFLMPGRPQVEAALRVAQAAQQRLAGRMEILYVLPDYFQDRPKPCMQGWGQRYLTVNPVGEVLPCPTAFSIPGLALENVREKSLDGIWHHSPAFNRFRGTEWMPLPCRACPQRDIDFGGCRCQAALLTGDPARTDPVCTLSPDRHGIDEILARSALQEAGIPRRYPAGDLH